jgi:hypothetical protein
MNSNAGGKGSAARPFSIDKEKFAQNWEAIFGKDPMSAARGKRISDVKEFRGAEAKEELESIIDLEFRMAATHMYKAVQNEALLPHLVLSRIVRDNGALEWNLTDGRNGELIRGE